MKLDFLVKFVDLTLYLICELVVLIDQLSSLVLIITFTRLYLCFKLTDFKESSQFRAMLFLEFLFLRSLLF